MISAIRGMTNVMEFQFEWTDLPLTEDTKTLLSSIATAFGANLRKLTLHAHVLNFRDLQIITASILVEELELHFDYWSRTSSTMKGNRNNEDQELLAVVLPLIVQSSSAMRSLRIFSSSSVDLSDFFAALPSMPRLQRFGAAIPFEKNMLSDSSGLLDFLRRHSSALRHIQLSPNLPYRTEMLQLRKKEVWEPVNDTLLDDAALLSCMESLEIPFVSPGKTIPLLQRSADTLTSLALTNHILSFVEVMEVLAVFSHRPTGLKTFYAEVDHFTTSQMKEYRKYRYSSQ
jgi:cell division protein ZapA (FtsZ GTPase activity inhibitor)